MQAICHVIIRLFVCMPNFVMQCEAVMVNKLRTGQCSNTLKQATYKHL